MKAFDFIVGELYKYTGVSDEHFTKGKFYECVQYLIGIEAWFEDCKGIERMFKGHEMDAFADDMSSLNTKESNPKDTIGTKKVSLSTVPSNVLMEISLGLLEGSLKYGRHNYREVGVRSHVYYDATMRHLMAWWEGEDIDPDSGLSHITKALSSLVVLRDAMMNNKVTDDRPPSLENGWIANFNKKAEELIERYPEPKQPYTRGTTES